MVMIIMVIFVVRSKKMTGIFPFQARMAEMKLAQMSMDIGIADQALLGNVWEWKDLPFYYVVILSNKVTLIRGAPQKNKTVFFGKTFPNMGGRGDLFHNRPKNHPENLLFWPEFYLWRSRISQKPWGGWVGSKI